MERYDSPNFVYQRNLPGALLYPISLRRRQTGWFPFFEQFLMHNRDCRRPLLCNHRLISHLIWLVQWFPTFFTSFPHFWFISGLHSSPPKTRALHRYTPHYITVFLMTPINVPMNITPKFVNVKINLVFVRGTNIRVWGFRVGGERLGLWFTDIRVRGWQISGLGMMDIRVWRWRILGLRDGGYWGWGIRYIRVRG